MAALDVSGGGQGEPAAHAFDIVPTDGVDVPFVTRGIYVGGAGAVRVDTLGGETVVFAAATAGSVLPVRAKRVYSTGTTATLLLGLY